MTILSHGQIGYNFTKQDTLRFQDLKFKQAIAFRLKEATVLIDRGYFFERLFLERNGLAKQIKSLQKMIKKGKGSPGITQFQLSTYQKQFAPVDSIFHLLKSNQMDTVQVDYFVFEKANSPFGDFMPKLLKDKACMIRDAKGQIQHMIIKRTGWKKTGQTTSVGSSFYYILGSEVSFWENMDWIS